MHGAYAVMQKGLIELEFRNPLILLFGRLKTTRVKVGHCLQIRNQCVCVYDMVQCSTFNVPLIHVGSSRR